MHPPSTSTVFSKMKDVSIPKIIPNEAEATKVLVMMSTEHHHCLGGTCLTYSAVNTEQQRSI